MKEFLKNKKFLTVFVLVLLIFLFILLGPKSVAEMSFDEKGQLILPEKSFFESSRSHANKMLKLYEEYQEAFYNDDFGGESPQETLDLFIQALQEGDLEKASRYFVVGKQEQMLKDFKIGAENGSLDLLLGDLEKEKTGSSLSETSYRFRTYDENNRAEFSFDLVLNEEKGIWKMESL